VPGQPGGINGCRAEGVAEDVPEEGRLGFPLPAKHPLPGVSGDEFDPEPLPPTHPNLITCIAGEGGGGIMAKRRRGPANGENAARVPVLPTLSVRPSRSPGRWRFALAPLSPGTWRYCSQGQSFGPPPTLPRQPGHRQTVRPAPALRTRWVQEERDAKSGGSR